MIVIAHRGASAEVEENTLEAFARAVEVGADMIELDLRISAEGVVFVAHDPVPPSGRRRRLLGPRLPGWSEVQARSGATSRYPTLHAVLDACADRIALNLEIKERAAVGPVVAELVRRGLGERILLSSFDPLAMRRARRLAPSIPRAYLCMRAPVGLYAALTHSRARSLHLGRGAVTARVVARAHDAGIPVYVWTVDDPEEMTRLMAIGVDGVFTNDPRRARELFPRR